MARTAIAYALRFEASVAGETGQTADAAVATGLTPAATFTDSDPDARDGLARALAAVAAGEAESLFVDRLQDVATSLSELLRLVDWLDAHGASLVAADVGFDSAMRSGRRSLALLREIDRWGREGDDRRRPRGRPGLKADAPELAERIGTLRDRGLSLRAIAEELNADGIPTPRGGASWRPSSVQAALGYQRPRPPAPGVPHPPPGPKGHGKKAGKKGPKHKGPPK